MVLLSDQVWVADQRESRLFVLDLQLDDIASSLYTEVLTLGPITDLSTLSTETYTHVYVASQHRIDIWDVDAEKWEHINLCFHTGASCDKFFFRQGRKLSVDNLPPSAHRVFGLILKVRIFRVWVGFARVVA